MDRIEYLHKNGYMPDRYYNQLNNKSIQENYNNAIMERNRQNSERLYKTIEAALQPTLEKALNEILQYLKP